MKLDFICMKMKLMKNKKYLQQKFSRQVLEPQTTAAFTSRVSKSYVPFTCKFPMVMHFVLFLHRRSRSKSNFYVFSYDKISLKFCASFKLFLAVFMEKFPKICYLSYVRRRISFYRYNFVKKLWRPKHNRGKHIVDSEGGEEVGLVELNFSHITTWKKEKLIFEIIMARLGLKPRHLAPTPRAYTLHKSYLQEGFNGPWLN